MLRQSKKASRTAQQRSRDCRVGAVGGSGDVGGVEVAVVGAVVMLGNQTIAAAFVVEPLSYSSKSFR